MSKRDSLIRYHMEQLQAVLVGDRPARPCCGCGCHVCAVGHSDKPKVPHTAECMRRFYEEQERMMADNSNPDALRTKGQEFFDRVLLPNLSEKELYELFCLIDEGHEDDLYEVLGDFSRRHFPEDFQG
jgi:hypothetical protein